MTPQAGWVAGWCPSVSGHGSNGNGVVMAMEVGVAVAVWVGALQREHKRSAGGVRGCKGVKSLVT